MVQLDSQANVSVFRDAHLLSNIRESAATLTIGGINADATSLIARHVGDFREFGTVWYHPDAGANIISLALAEDFAVVEYDRSRTTFTASPFTGGVPYEFFRLHGMHVCDLNAHDAPSQVFAVTVEAQERQYTSREVKSAKEARRLIRALGYPSPRSVIDMINNGTLTECPVTAKDVARAYEIYGPDVGALRGKTTITPSIPYKGKILPRTVQAEPNLQRRHHVCGQTRLPTDGGNPAWAHPLFRPWTAGQLTLQSARPTGTDDPDFRLSGPEVQSDHSPY